MLAFDVEGFFRRIGLDQFITSQRRNGLGGMDQRIRAMAEHVGITTRLVMASELEVSGSSTRLMVNLTTALGGDVYLSGPTGRRYLEPELFPAAFAAGYAAFSIAV